MAIQSVSLRFLSCGLALAVCTPTSASLHTSTSPPAHKAERVDLGDFSLAELMELEVTVASRAPQKASEVPAAVYVVTGDEIRRAGHSSVMEALRMVPGFYVSHWTNSNWDITSRGFGNGIAFANSAYLNQLLVMIDGVEVYTPLFAGMWWAIQDVDLNDIDRIEVIRGPGGVVWGANAVHGVVNIIMKHTQDTQGYQLHAWNGNDDRHSSMRYGGSLGERGTYRAWVKRSEYDNPHDNFAGYDYSWWISSGGFQADWESDSGRESRVWVRGYSGDFGVIAYDLDTFEAYQGIDQKTGGQFSYRNYNPDSGETWHASATTDQQNLPTLADININVYDFGYSRQHDLGESHHLNWGVGFRVIDVDIFGDDPFWYAFTEGNETQEIPRIYAVDTIDLKDDEFKMIVSVQAEDNHFTGIEIQPSVKFQWIPSDEWNFWTGVSRAVRTPSIEERRTTSDSIIMGNPDFDSESVVSYELGARKIISETALFDLALFYNDYDDLHMVDADPDTGFDIYTNNANGYAYGAELAIDVQATERLKFRGAYSYLSGHYRMKPDGEELMTDLYVPKHSANVRASYNMTDEWELDVNAYGVEGMGSTEFASWEIAEYWRGDVRLGYNPSDELELSLGVQSWNEPTRSEFDGFDHIRRSVFFALTWRP